MRVVIVGGGFAAVKFAETLRKKLRGSECEILLFNRENHMVFHPLLADVAGASINADAAVAPLRQMLPESSVAPSGSRELTFPLRRSNSILPVARWRACTTTTS